MTTPPSADSGRSPGALGGGPATGATAPVAPPLGSPPEPAGAGAAPGGRRFRPRALVVALAVLLTGAVAGAGMFALEQSSVTWRPHVTRRASDWRIAAPHGLVIHDAALSGRHLAWASGPYTVVFDLSTGKSKLLGIARHASSDAPAAVSEFYAAWLEGAESSGPSIWTYQFSTSARRRLTDTPGVVSAPALSGSTLVWAGRQSGATGGAKDGDVAVFARDLGTGAGRVVTKGPHVTGPVVADWPRVGWGENAAVTGAAGQVSYFFAVKDVGSGQTYAVDLLAGVTSATLMNIDLSGTTLAWRLQTGGGSGEVLMRDLTGGTTQPVASGPGLSGGSIDGDRVVWAQPAGGGTSIMCRRLSGGAPFAVATVAAGTVTDVLVGGDTVAWIVVGGQNGFNGIETARLVQ